ncbi:MULTISPECIES: PAS-domain containing protein [unclassified Delftia]|uniref:hybrid sensor histidine kinase/response regulator n=1 Tax=unclassified Delftia TaxID=2613839 RepID=UPI00114EC6F1|nr:MULTISPECIES: PAS-domain containing protein [unclassified Delftia]MCB4787626.1 PAS-domain containing protein [Delftia sp. Lp-1]TQL73271.1 histidine kinase [Delftia sp. HK171]
MPQPVRRPSRRSFWTLLLLFGGMLACMLLAGELVYHRALRGEAESVQRQLSLYAQALGQRIDRYRTLPEVLALDAQLRAALTHPLSAAEVDALNRKLEQANGASQSSTLTLIDRHGTALAASNWRETRSNVGVDYSFRPYVQQALSRGSGRFYGIGLTTGLPGYFLSQAILDEQNAVAGLVVIKIALLELEREWLQTPDVVMASDEHGVVFLASQPDWRYRLLSPLSPIDEADLAATRQYIDQELHPMRYRVRQGLEQGSRLVQMQEPALPGTTLWQTLPLPGSDWQLHLLHDTQASTVASRWAAAAAAGGWLALGLLVLFVRQRRRLAALRLRSRLELETVLRQHAQELRTAQDGIVQAARQADTGLSRSLEHLPQGVVVIDADLNLVAWNSRYVELFRFPSELLRTGQPIENLFRYNARRGLLGPGPIEEAIHRRLQHLRSGSPHLRESTKDDGTVLEIRGNPLPDGGFVTSYADITSYKNAARELRSLADALEQRIAERTRDLAEAKREAEQANRYKTRFVAAAVHDLLQPLNAARMFSSLLRSHLHDDAGRHVADSIDGALAAQDAILGSLLDISRMESGQLEVRVRDFALGPLLQVMRHNFGILAESRGLRLSAVDTRCVVRSDEALLRRILQNFLSNAIRYTRQGRIVIGCRRQGQQLRIEVHDQGPGIPESLQHEIFEEFRRLDEGHGDDRGAGLGLAIVERLGRLLGHEIGLRSHLGRGSVFWVCVPLGDPAAVPQIAAATHSGEAGQDAPLQGMSAWYVEDDAQSCTAMRALLQRWGCNVPLAGGPAEALALAAPGEAPQLVLLDVRLGQLHGPDVYAQLCQRWGQSPPVILVTAERDGMVRRQAAERGWGFLAKPVRPPALRALMSQMLLRHR